MTLTPKTLIEDLQERTLITLDFETYYSKTYSLRKLTTPEYIGHPSFEIWGLGIKVEDQETTWHPGMISKVFESLFKIVEANGGWGKVKILAHNTPFDAMILMSKTKNIPLNKVIWLDTAAMARGVWPTYPADLKSVAVRLWPDDVSMRKGKELSSFEGKTHLTLDDYTRLGHYCKKDCDLTYHIFKKLEPHFPDEELLLIHLTTKWFCSSHFRLDNEILEDAIATQTVEKERALIAARVKHPIELSSNQRFAKMIEKMGLEVPTKTSPTTGLQIPALGKTDIDYMTLQAEHPEFANIWNARRIVKSTIKASRAQRFIDITKANRGILPIALKYYAAGTGRWGGTEKMNQQNLTRIDKNDPKSGVLRRSMLAPPGHQVLVADSSQIEARMLAWVSDYKEELNLYRTKQDVYTALAAKIYHVQKEEIVKGQRDVGKVSRLGLGFGMGHAKFWLTMNTGPMGMPPILISKQESQQIVSTFREVASPIVAFWQLCEKFLEYMLDPQCNFDYGCLKIRHQMIILPNGMALKYPGLKVEPSAFGQSFSYKHGQGYWTSIYGGLLTENIVQALARIVVAQQMLQIEEEFLIKYKVGATAHMVHDEVIAILQNSVAEEATNRMLEIMSEPPDWCSTIPLAAEGGFAERYIK